jgi:hypothetical protein
MPQYHVNHISRRIGKKVGVIRSILNIFFLYINPKTVALQENSAACSCLDCEASCPGSGGLAPLPSEADEEFEIAGLYGLGFIMGIVYIVLVVAFLSLLFLLRRTKRKFLHYTCHSVISRYNTVT